MVWFQYVLIIGIIVMLDMLLLVFWFLLLLLQGWMSAVFWLCPLAVTCPLYRVPWVMIPWVSILWNRQQLYAVSLSWLRLWWNSTWVPGWLWMTLYFSRSVPGEACCIRVMRQCTARMSHVTASVGSLVTLIWCRYFVLMLLLCYLKFWLCRLKLLSCCVSK